MKKLLLVALIGVFVGGCTVFTEKENYDFVDYGINDSTNEVLVAKDGKSVAWVYQEAVDDVVKNIVYSANRNGENKTVLIEMNIEKERDLRIMGYYPETKSFIYAFESLNQEFGTKIQREVFYKFFDEESARRIGKDFLDFLEIEKGVIGIQVGKVVAYYQFSMNNSYAIDTVVNYNKDKETPSMFTDAMVTNDKQRIVYVHAYEPETQGYNQNKVLVSGLEGEKRRELVASAEPIELIAFVDDNTIKVKIGEEEKDIDF